MPANDELVDAIFAAGDEAYDATDDLRLAGESVDALHAAFLAVARVVVELAAACAANGVAKSQNLTQRCMAQAIYDDIRALLPKEEKEKAT